MTGGVNRLPPVGLMLFSVGDGEGACELEVEGVVVVVVVVEVDGALPTPPEHATNVANSEAQITQPAALLRH
jgi:hypothetical protein